MIKFSVLIANYNNGKYIKTCLDSIYKQDYKNVEIILVDDNSTDNSLEIINEYIKKSPYSFKLIQNKTNMGCGFTKALCVESASGEICGFLDSDDLLVPNAITKMVQYHEDNKNCSLISSRHMVCNKNMKPLYCCKYSSQSNFKGYLRNPLLSHFNTFKREYYLKTEGINKKITHGVDQDLCLKLEEVGNILFVDDILYFYRTFPKSISNSRGGAQKAMFYNLFIRFEAVRRRGENPSFLIGLYKFEIKYQNWLINKIRILYNFLWYRIKKW